LSENNEFIDIVMSASAAAVRTANDKKREALRNAVLNTAIGRSPEESLAQVFVSLVDQFTDWHLRILQLFRYPGAYSDIYNISSGAPAGLIERVYPQLKDKRQFYLQVWRDLYQRGLVESDSDILLTGMTGTSSGVFAKRTTNLGDSFLAFITA
jgi:hypothetical protein